MALTVSDKRARSSSPTMGMRRERSVSLISRAVLSSRLIGLRSLPTLTHATAPTTRMADAAAMPYSQKVRLRSPMSAPRSVAMVKTATVSPVSVTIGTLTYR
jgi:hypothetical protein